MGKPAARLTDLHTCPMITPGVPPVPHVGGPVAGPGVPTVIIGGMPATVIGDMCICVGPPDSVIMGSTGVFIGGKPAARMGDMTAHGGTISLGCPTVLIGEAGGGAAGMGSNVILKEFKKAVKNLDKESGVQATMLILFKLASEQGTMLVHDASTCSVCSGKKK